jgi:hypothetical protein
MTLGASQRLLSHLARSLHPDDLRGHFVLGERLPFVPENWATHQLGAWTLAVEQRLPVIKVLDERDNDVGWLVGHAFELRSASPVTSVRLNGNTRADVRLEIDRWLDGTSGRYALLLPGMRAVSPDALATLPILFDGERGLVSSSPFLLQHPDEPIPDDDLTEVFRIDESSLWYMFDATPHGRARRLLPNHVLDLATWTTFRIWPSGPLQRSSREEEAERIANTLEQTMTAAATTEELNLSLTAGGDTRMLLACSRAILDRTHFFTIAQPDDIGHVDTWLAPKIALRFGLDHRELQWRGATRTDVSRFRIRTGALIGEPRGSRAGPTYAQLGDARPYVPAVGGRVESGWRKDDTPSMRLDGIDLLKRYGVPTHQRLVDAAARWLVGVPGLDAIDTLTLLGLELRAGLWGGPLTTAYPDAYTYTLYPFAQRVMTAAQLQRPYSDRRGLDVRKDVIRLRWPELLEFPINRGGSYRFRLARAVRHRLLRRH